MTSPDSTTKIHEPSVVFHRAGRFTVATLLLAFFALAQTLRAEVRLPKVFSSHMVVQRQKPMIVWGWAKPGEKVTVEFATHRQQTKANRQGEWKVELPAMEAGGPYELKVTGSNKINYDDVMVGEVWLCSGQSNMEMGIGNVQDAEKEIAAANHPEIRLLKVNKKWSAVPLDDIQGQWLPCSPETIVKKPGWNGFSAAAYFFGRELQKKLGVTVGLIDSSWGGTRVESWTPPEGFAAVPVLKHEYDLVELGDPRTKEHMKKLDETIAETKKWLVAAREAELKRNVIPTMPVYPPELLPPHDVQNATALYNGSIHPLQPFALRGAIWYQGESNYQDGSLYGDRMNALITGWRKVWGEGDFPFYFVQIAPFNYGGDAGKMGIFWEAQTRAANTVPNSGIVVINDIGNTTNIHPTNKQEVGRRLALLALAKTYGQTDVVSSGPTYKSMKIEGNKLRVTFDNIGGGLASRDGKPLDWFELMDADEGGFIKADATIDGSSVVLSSEKVANPVAVHFAWSDVAEPNLMNKEGLPANSFRAGTEPSRDLLVLHVPESDQYTLVYDLDLSKLGADIKYDVDKHADITQPFDRIAYFLELQKPGAKPDYLYVSMDAFTKDIKKVGIPTRDAGARYQKNVANMNVYCNVRGVATGNSLAGGNIEFWPNNYNPTNSANVPGASGTVFDFGDQPENPKDGYGSMQVHNHDAMQTLFALNHWKEGKKADLGIGSQATGNPDWTFAANAESYEVKRLRVLVRLK